MFLNDIHRLRFQELMKKDNTNEGDLERIALFYVIAGNEDLSDKVTFIYDFDDHSIISECLESEKVDFCSTSVKLIKLGFNLYNSFPSDSIIDIFSTLNERNFNLAINAIQVRFKHQSQGYL